MSDRLRQPTIAEVVAELENPTAEINFCRNIRDGRFHSWVKPEEVYIEALGMWLRADGSQASFALRGFKEYGRDSRRTLRNAIQHWAWQRAHSPGSGDILKVLNRTTKPKDWDGTFEQAIATAMNALLDMKPELPR